MKNVNVSDNTYNKGDVCNFVDSEYVRFLA